MLRYNNCVKKTFTDGQFNRALELYESGLSQTAVADVMGVTRSWLRLRFIERGVKLRRNWGAKWRRCRGCEKVLEATKDNFYHKKDYLCKACAKKKSTRITRETKFDVSQAKYDIMLDKQNGVCLICGEPPGKKSLAVDHDHTSGEVRGLLCTSCNRGLGYFRDDVDILKQAITYLCAE